MYRFIYLIFTFLLFVNANGQTDVLTSFTIKNNTLKLSDFTNTKKFPHLPYGDDKETISDKKRKVYQIHDIDKIHLLNVKGSLLFIVVNKQQIVQDYWLRIEGVENVKKMYDQLYQLYPKMTSYNDGVLRFKHFNNNKVLEFTINNIRPSDVFMDLHYTIDYENTSLNMFKNYDANKEQIPQKINFKYNSTEAIYEISKTNDQ